jgi:hypothetical protein
VKHALDQCLDAMKDLQKTIDKLAPATHTPQSVQQKLKQVFRRSKYPAMRDTLQGMLKRVNGCQDALNTSLGVLNVHPGADVLSQLH